MWEPVSTIWITLSDKWLPFQRHASPPHYESSCVVMWPSGQQHGMDGMRSYDCLPNQRHEEKTPLHTLACTCIIDAYINTALYINTQAIFNKENEFKLR